jgi:hypothetical protein
MFCPTSDRFTTVHPSNRLALKETTGWRFEVPNKKMGMQGTAHKILCFFCISTNAYKWISIGYLLQENIFP